MIHFGINEKFLNRSCFRFRGGTCLKRGIFRGEEVWWCWMGHLWPATCKMAWKGLSAASAWRHPFWLAEKEHEAADANINGLFYGHAHIRALMEWKMLFRGDEIHINAQRKRIRKKKDNAGWKNNCSSCAAALRESKQAC